MSAYLPLEGVRICDFTAVWAGQSATMYLADLGAECIKVENPYIWNPMTRAAAATINKASAAAIPPWLGGHPNDDPGPRPWNNSPGFIHVLRNKKSFTVDSRRPEGQAIVRALVRSCDIVAENLVVGTLDKVGLSDDEIRAERPDAIILHMPAFGIEGEYREGRGYGSHMDASASMTYVRGYADTAPESNVQIVAGDFFNGMHGAVAVLAALRHRRRTGEGQVIEQAQNEVAMNMVAQSLIEAAWNGRSPRAIGNRSVEGFVPNGVFPTRGDDEWIAISCRSDVEWRALVAFIGSPAWATSGELATAEGRAAHEDAIEQRLAEWTAPMERESLFHDLQSAGVTAGPVLNAKDAAEDPHLAATGAWVELPATEDYPATKFSQPPFHFSRSDVTIRGEPALFGQHNEYVYREVLGLSDEQYAELVQQGHVRDRFDQSIAP